MMAPARSIEWKAEARKTPPAMKKIPNTKSTLLKIDEPIMAKHKRRIARKINWRNGSYAIDVRVHQMPVKAVHKANKLSIAKAVQRILMIRGVVILSEGLGC